MASRYSSISELIGLLYASAEEPMRWRFSLECCLEFLGGCEAILFTPHLSPDAGGLSIFSVLAAAPTLCGDERPLDSSEDARQVRGLTLANCVAALVEDGGRPCSVEQGSTLPACNVLQDLSGHLLACDYSVRDGLQDQRVLFGLRRSALSPVFTDKEIALATLIFPHIGQAVSLHFRFAALIHHRQLADIGWAHLPGPQGIVDSLGRLVYLNKSLQCLLDKADGLFLKNDQLGCKHRGASKQVQAALVDLSTEGAVDPAPKVIRVQLSSGKPDQLLVMSRLHNDGRSRLLGIQIKIVDLSSQSQVPCEIFKEIFRLTNAECRLLEGLLAGLSPKDASVRFDLTTNTIRSQMKSIYLKTGVHRQVELMRMVMGLTVLDMK